MTRNVVVIGYGVTGRAVSRVLRSQGDHVTVFDDHPPAGEDVEMTPAGSELRERIGAADLIVPSPGVPVGHPVLSVALDTGRPVVSEIELAAELADRPGGPSLVAITGTNGKTTVTTLVEAMLNQSGVPALAAGNIGLPLVDAVQRDLRVVVAEVSSFQLNFARLGRPAVSCWLNLSPDHLDWHPDLVHYAAAKARIWANQGGGDQAVWNADDAGVSAAAAQIPPDVARVPFTVTGDRGYHVAQGWLVGPEGRTIAGIDELPRAFPHDVANALAALASASAAGATDEGCRAALAASVVMPHRVSLVGESAGVAWYDDSKATTPASVLAAVSGFSSVVLIAGGRNKGLDLGVLASTIPPVRAAVGIGEAAREVGRAVAGLIPFEAASNMEQAVEAAGRLARAGDAVILSPGCASFDWYTSYAARGDHFAAIVRKTLDQRGATW